MAQVTEDKEIAALIRDIVAAGWPEGLAAERAAMEAEAPVLAGDIRVSPITLAERPAEILTAPTGSGGGAILYLHGGGYVYGSLDSHRGLAGEIARATRSDVLNLDYRLAPENPFPAALEDAVSATRACYAFGITPETLVLMGDSAGGGTRARDVARPAGRCFPAAKSGGVPLSMDRSHMFRRKL